MERLFAVHPHDLFRKGIVADLYYYFLSNLVPALLLSVLIGLLAWAAHRIVPEGFLAAMSALPIWARAIVGSLHLPGEWPEDYGIKAKMPEALVDQPVYPLFPPPAPERVERPEAVEAIS